MLLRNSKIVYLTYLNNVITFLLFIKSHLKVTIAPQVTCILQQTSAEEANFQIYGCTLLGLPYFAKYVDDVSLYENRND